MTESCFPHKGAEDGLLLLLVFVVEECTSRCISPKSVIKTPVFVDLSDPAGSARCIASVSSITPPLELPIDLTDLSESVDEIMGLDVRS